MDNHQVEVIVVGAGPVGLATALQLGRAGIRTLVVERHAGLSEHAKAGGIHARTMEIFRQWGLAQAIRTASGRPPTEFIIAWMTRMTGQELGTFAIGADMEDFLRFRSWSPEFNCGCGQDRYEPILLAEARRQPSVEFRFHTEASGVEQGADGVSVTLRDRTTDVSTTVKARYVIAADGSRSRIRTALGLTETAEPSFGNSINIRFRAPLEPYRAGRRYLLFWVVNPDTQGAFAWTDDGDNWIYNFEALPGEDPAIYDEARCIEVIRQAVGVADLPVQIESILHWQHGQAVADAWRKGRVFLVGDSAHRFPPHGGFGMNSGVQDSLNLVWKLVAVLRWGAGDGLLDTYEPERKPVAQLNASQCIINTHRMQETGWLMPDPSVLEVIEKPEGEALRRQITAAIPRQREQFYSQGQQFGAIYRSAAVIADGTQPELSTISDYRPTAHPGARAPHMWLKGEGEAAGERSTIDLHDGGFTLLAARNGEAWREAAAAASAKAGVPLACFVEGDFDFDPAEPGARWDALCGLAPSGAVLVRPDGHVAMRAARLPDDPARTLAEALTTILCASG